MRLAYYCGRFLPGRPFSSSRHGRGIKIVEVGPRDGLQNEPSRVDTSVKHRLIGDLAAAGLRSIEVTSFVSPKWVPQMADAARLFRLARDDLQSLPDMDLPVLVPNEKGLEQAVAAGAKEIAVFTAASEAFNQKNINCSIDESLARIGRVVERARLAGIAKIRGYLSCVVGCPYGGWIEPEQVQSVASALLSLGCYQVSLGDTIGIGTPGHFRRLLAHLTGHVPAERLAVHCHDTFGQALANVLESVENFGIRTVDAAVAGLGGCPYAPGATGNVATEDVVYMLHGLGYETGVDLEKLVRVGDAICRDLGRRNDSRTANAILRRTRSADSK